MTHKHCGEPPNLADSSWNGYNCFWLASRKLFFACVPVYLSLRACSFSEMRALMKFLGPLYASLINVAVP